MPKFNRKLNFTPEDAAACSPIDLNENTETSNISLRRSQRQKKTESNSKAVTRDQSNSKKGSVVEAVVAKLTENKQTSSNKKLVESIRKLARNPDVDCQIGDSLRRQFRKSTSDKLLPSYGELVLKAIDSNTAVAHCTSFGKPVIDIGEDALKAVDTSNAANEPRDEDLEESLESRDETLVTKIKTKRKKKKSPRRKTKERRKRKILLALRKVDTATQSTAEDEPINSQLVKAAERILKKKESMSMEVVGVNSHVDHSVERNANITASSLTNSTRMKTISSRAVASSSAFPPIMELDKDPMEGTSRSDKSNTLKSLKTGRVSKKKGQNKKSLSSSKSKKTSCFSSSPQYIPTEVSGLRISLTLKNRYHHCSHGHMTLGPGICKPSTPSSNHSLDFFVIQGEAEVEVNNEIHRVKEMDSFTVPQGFQYCIKNINKRSSLILTFVKRKPT